MGKENEEGGPLFETKRGKGRILYRLFASSIFVGVLLIWAYRVSRVPNTGEDGRLVWIGMLAAELWFGIYWILTQSLRWNPIYRFTFRDRLLIRHENELPRVDIFVCTADPVMEPPSMVINTVLSVMAYDYPPEKLSVYLSDDGGSELTFYALLEASRFAKHWIPYCKRFKVEPRSPAAYFASEPQPGDDGSHSKDLAVIKELYDDIAYKIETVTKFGRIPEDIRREHRGFSLWDSISSRHDHDTIIQMLIDGKDPEAMDVERCRLPTLVYLSREKRPQHPHHFKAGAMNALIRVSSKISNGRIILNVDCDMYSNNSESVKDALCFFMDEEKGHEFAFVQFPQSFNNITENDLYGGSLRVLSEVEFHGLDGFGGPLYVGTGCFHRRDTLCGTKFSKDSRCKWKEESDRRRDQSVSELEGSVKALASCTFEQSTEWGNEMGLKYGCPVEDVITGLSIQSNGWKSVYFNPPRKAFLGVSPTSLDQTLVQHKRWSEGDLQILLSRYSPAWYGIGKINPGLLMGYLNYCLWSPNCMPMLYYSVIPSLYLLRGISLFPAPMDYVISATYAYNFSEFLLAGGTALGWWNEQRIWLYKRTSSFLFAFVDTLLKLVGSSNSGFGITAKVADEDVSRRYEKEMMEFGTTSIMLTILASLAMLNLFCFAGALMRVAVAESGARIYENVSLQIVLCGLLVSINWPLYIALLFRKDKGRIPSSVAAKSSLFALFACTCFSFLQ